MRPPLLLSLALSLPGLALATDEPRPASPAHLDTVVVEKPVRLANPDQFQMSSGSVLARRGSESARLTEDVKLLDGTILTPGGTVRRKDGAETQLVDGQTIAIDGKMGHVPATETLLTPNADLTPAAKPR